MNCPCCGQPVQPKGRLESLQRSLSPVLEGPVLGALMDARRPLRAADIASKVYNGPDGGAMDAQATVRVTIWRLRRKVRETGFHIARNRAGYYLAEVAA